MKTRKQMRQKRKKGIRVHVNGTAARPRLAVYRSNTRLLAQLVDDVTQVTVASAWVKGKNKAQAAKLGLEIAKKAKDKHITSVVFDRGGFRYHGVVAQVADSAREGGLVL